MGGRYADNRAEFDSVIARLRYAVAADAMRQAVWEVELKAGYDPNQPRVPAGRRFGGQWTRFGLSHYAEGFSDLWMAIEREAGGVSLETLAFIRRNRTAITRTLGLVQAAGGFGELFGGVAAVTGGVATSEVGVGIGVAAIGAYLVSNGYDNFTTGWATFVTGESQPTRLNALLRSFGLTEAQAAAAEVGFAGTAGAAAGLSGRALEKAARRGLEVLAVRRFSTAPLQVRVNGQSLWLEQDIVARGEAWEAFDAARTGFKRTPPGFRTFDQVSLNGESAISNKAIDLLGPSYERPGALYRRLKQHIDAVANFKGDFRSGIRIEPEQLEVRELHIPFANRPLVHAQTAQIEAARHQAARQGVVMTIEYAD